jgi:hypothetical protein
MMNNMEEPDQEPEPPNNLNQPVWCKCGLCVIMPNLGREQMLHTNSLAMFEYKPTFYSTCFGWQCVGFGNVLDLAMRYRELRTCWRCYILVTMIILGIQPIDNSSFGSMEDSGRVTGE